jgi:galactose mutarotase-like enzyme
LAERRAASVGALLSRLTGRRERLLDASDRPGEIELQAAGVRVVIVPAWGGRITALELGGRQWLSPSEPPSEDPERRSLDAALAGGYQECFPTVLPCRVLSKHTGVAFEQPALGELHRLVPAAEIATLEGAVEATCTWTGDRLPYRFVRVVRASPGEISMRYEVTNTGSAPMPFLWAANVAMPLGEGTRLTLPENARSKVISQEGIDLLGVGAEHRWPRFRTSKKLVDMSTPDSIGGRFACHLSFEVASGLAMVAEGAQRLEVRFDAEQVSRVGLNVRRKLGSSGARLVTLQPAIGVPGALASAAGVDGSAAWLEPGQSRQWALTWRAAQDEPDATSSRAVSGQ